MPTATPSEDDVPQMSAMTELLEKVLIHAQTIKPASTIEPPLTKSHFNDFIDRLSRIASSSVTDHTQQSRDSDKVRLYAAVETAARKIFSSVIVSRDHVALCPSIQLRQ